MTLAAFIASLGLYRTLGSELIPELVQGEFFADIELPPGTRLEVTDRKLQDYTRATSGFDGLRSVYTIAGTSNEQGGTAGELREYLGQITVALEPPVSRALEDHAMDQLRQTIEQDNQSAGAGPAASPGSRPPVVARFDDE